MPYHYSNPTLEKHPTALPDVEIFEACGACGPNLIHEATDSNYTKEGCPGYDREAFFFAFGFPGCLWDSEPVGPYDTEEEALTAAREEAAV